MSALPSYAEVAAVLLADTSTVGAATDVSLRSALGRYLAHDLVALTALPAFHHAVMDGYALGAMPPREFALRETSDLELLPTQAQSIRTGEATPSGTVAVVMRDHAQQTSGTVVVNRASRKTNIRVAGEEAQPGDILIKAGTKLDARHLALAQATGHQTISVTAKVNVMMLGIGDGAAPHMSVFEALLTSPALAFDTLGSMSPCNINLGSIKSDALFTLIDQLKARSGLLIVVSESLDGEAGPLALALQNAGATITVHRAALKPAKPIIEAQLGGLRIIGLSGTAYACLVAAQLFLQPILTRMVGAAKAPEPTPVQLGFGSKREQGRAEALPVTVTPQRNAISAGRFGQMSALAAMDGFVLIGADSTELRIGDTVSYWPVQMPLV